MRTFSSPFLFITGVAIVLFPLVLFAAPPDSPYLPGETLSPNCLPSSQHCSVKAFISALGEPNQVLMMHEAGTHIEYRSPNTSMVPEFSNLYYTNERVASFLETLVNSAGGLAGLDLSGKIPTSLIPSALLGAVNYRGSWDANQNEPALESGVGSKGDYYVVNVAGSFDLDGISTWNLGDWAIYNGSVWERVSNSDAVTSVNGRTGAVVLNADDVGMGSWAGSSFVTMLGTIASGIWQGTSIGPTYGGTGLSSVAAGSVLYGSDTDVISALPAGTDGQVLKMSGGLPAWGTDISGTGTSAWGFITGDIASQIDLSSILAGKEPTISAGSESQYWRGDKTWQTLDKSAVGLGNVENTALSTWTGSSNLTSAGIITSGTWNGDSIAVDKGGTGASSAAEARNNILPSQTSQAGKFLTTDGSGNVSWGTPSAAEVVWGDIEGTISDQTDLASVLSGKEPTITTGTTSQYFRGDKTWQTLDKNAVGLGNVDNTSDADKPVSGAVLSALDLKQDILGFTPLNPANNLSELINPVAALASLLPSQSSNGGKFLKTDGLAVFHGTCPALISMSNGAISVVCFQIKRIWFRLFQVKNR